MKKEMVGGLLLSPDHKRVALIRKNRPKWQAGRYNLIGGKIEEGESALQAMHREFQEEAGVSGIPWEGCFMLVGVDWLVHVFVAADERLDEIKSLTDEEVKIFEITSLPANIISNISWLVPLAKNYLETPQLIAADAHYV